MKSIKVILLVLYIIVNAVGNCNAQVTLPLYLNSKVTKNHFIKHNHDKNTKNALEEEDGFQNSIVYASMDLLKRSGERGKRLMKVMKRARMTHLRNARSSNKLNNKMFVDRRLLRRKVGQEQTLKHHYPLFQGYGSHYVTARVGTPPQQVTLLVDTGSDETAFPCKGCSTCGDEHVDPSFDPDESTTFQAVSCNQCTAVGSYCKDTKCFRKNSYLEGSEWSGYAATDQFFLGSNKKDKDGESIKENFNFICQTSETGLFKKQLENGIMGLSLRHTSNLHLPTVLHNTNKIPSNEFSLCMRVENFISKEGYHAGLMTIGGVDTTYHSSKMMYASTTGHYDVRIRSLYLQKSLSSAVKENNQEQDRTLKDDDRVFQLPGDYSIYGSHTIDSGTTTTYFNSGFEHDFKKEWKHLTGFDFPNDENEVITLSNEQFNNLPTILVQLEGNEDEIICNEANNQTIETSTAEVRKLLDGNYCNDVIISYPPSHYLYKVKKGSYSIEFSFEPLGIGRGILGANIIQGHDVLFDLTNQRIGFARSNCKYR